MFRFIRKKKSPATPGSATSTAASSTPGSATSSVLQAINASFELSSVPVPLKFRTNSKIRLPKDWNVAAASSDTNASPPVGTIIKPLNPTQVQKGINAIENNTAQVKLKSSSMSKPQTHSCQFSENQNSITFKNVESKRKKKKNAHVELFFHSVNAFIPANQSNLNATMSKKKYHVKHPWVFTLFINEANERIDLVCQSLEEYNLWYAALSFLVREKNIDYDSDPMMVLIMRTWMKADENMDGQLDLEEVQNMLKTLNLSLTKSRIKSLYASYDTDNSGYLEFEEFIEFYKSLMKREEPDRLFVKYRGDLEDRFLYVDSFQSFLQNEQHDNRSREDTIALMKKVGAVETGDGKLGLSKENFSRYFFSNLNFAIPYENWSTVHQDMTQPLTHYWIASSNNTYLTADQLKGSSSVAMYRKALHRGCRCVSLDCWDGTPDLSTSSRRATQARSPLSSTSSGTESEDVIVTHGRTLTSKISFREVIECIDSNAFTFNQYPVIVSLEVHCSEKQQRVMASILKEIFGDKIFTLEELNQNDGVWPSPEQLKKRIIIKAKRIESGSVFDDYEDSPEDAQLRKKKLSQIDFKPITEELSNLTALSTVIVGQSDFQQPSGNVDGEESKSATISVKALSNDTPCWEMHNWSENRLEQAIRKLESNQLATFTQNHFIRVHPKSTRFNSSNFSPIPAWLHGCQMVALNYQTSDTFLALNQLLFNYNARCGLLLKPENLRNGFSNYSTLASHCLEIRVVCAEQLPPSKVKAAGEDNDIMDPYVRLQLISPTTVLQRSTSVVQDNGFAPSWNEDFSFDVKNPEVEMLRISIFDKNTRAKDTLIVEQLVRISDLQDGYRLLPLCSRDGRVVDHCVILLNIALKKLGAAGSKQE